MFTIFDAILSLWLLAPTYLFCQHIVRKYSTVKFENSAKNRLEKILQMFQKCWNGDSIQYTVCAEMGS